MVTCKGGYTAHSCMTFQKKVTLYFDVSDDVSVHVDLSTNDLC